MRVESLLDRRYRDSVMPGKTTAAKAELASKDRKEIGRQLEVMPHHGTKFEVVLRFIPYVRGVVLIWANLMLGLVSTRVRRTESQKGSCKATVASVESSRESLPEDLETDFDSQNHLQCPPLGNPDCLNSPSNMTWQASMAALRRHSR